MSKVKTSGDLIAHSPGDSIDRVTGRIYARILQGGMLGKAVWMLSVQSQVRVSSPPSCLGRQSDQGTAVFVPYERLQQFSRMQAYQGHY